jgi:hypothetical protein
MKEITLEMDLRARDAERNELAITRIRPLSFLWATGGPAKSVSKALPLRWTSPPEKGIGFRRPVPVHSSIAEYIRAHRATIATVLDSPSNIAGSWLKWQRIGAGVTPR